MSLLSWLLQTLPVTGTPIWRFGALEPVVDLLNVIFLLFLVVCGYTDTFHRKIYNKVTYPAMLLGIVGNTIATGWHGLQTSLFGLVLGFGLFFLAWMFGGMGGGDVKLMGAIGALQGYPFVMYAMSFGVLVGFLGSLWVIVQHGRLWRSLWNVVRTVVLFLLSRVVPTVTVPQLNPRDSVKIPFGYGLCLGTLVAWWLITTGQLTM